jgi:large subunit ribosomal protein L22
MPWKSTYKYARISPRKARLVLDMIRGADVSEALDILRFTPNRAADMISKCLTSAVANANEADADPDRLYVQECQVDEGPTMRRIRPKDRGRAHLIRKRTSHIVVVVDED